MEFYDETVDYKQKHLDFLYAQPPNFRGHRSAGSKDWELTDYEMMHEVYKNPVCNNINAYRFYINDIKKKFAKQYAVNEEQELAKKLYGKQDVKETNVWFITVGFDKSNYTDAKALKCVDKLLTYEWIISAEVVMEWYTETGFRPHIMFRCETPKNYGKTKQGEDKVFYRSRVAEAVFKSSDFRRYKLVGAVNHVDVKDWEQRHVKYIDLSKSDKKMEYVVQDQEYREKNGIQERWIKECV